MKAARYHTFGSPEVLKIEEVQTPQPKDDQVLVEVFTTSVNSGDCHLRSGDPFIARLFAGPFTPRNKVLGTTFSGRVAQVGSQVTRFRVGDEVYGSYGIESGTHAEFLTISENDTISHKPDHLSHEQAVSLVFGSITALYFLKRANIAQGKRVLIIGAAGGVGSYGVQLAKLLGAHVTAVCSSKDIDYVKDLGADHIIDYRKQTVLEHCKQNDLSFDIILDMVCNMTISGLKSIMKDQSTYTGTVARLPLLIESAKKNQNKQFVFDVSKASHKDIDYFSELSLSKGLRPLIAHVFPLDDIVKAHQLVENKSKKGAVIVKVK